MSTVTKRTRSQLTLMDMGPGFQLNRSPLKAARMAARGNMTASKSEPSRLRNAIEDDRQDSDDELLLSPKKSNPKKRSSSPFDQEHPFEEADAERASKKAKRDNDAENSNAPPSPKPLGPFDFAALSPKKPVFATHNQPIDSPRKRAQSVPPRSPSSVPHIDLRNIPASPRRAPSTSPQRPRLRFTSVPHELEHPKPIDEDVRMDVDEPSRASTHLNIFTPIGTHSLTPSDDIPPSPLTPFTTTPPSNTTSFEMPISSEGPLDDVFTVKPLQLTPHEDPVTPKAQLTQPDVTEDYAVPLNDAATPKAVPPPPSFEAVSASDTPTADLSSVSDNMPVDKPPEPEPVSEPPVSVTISRPPSALSVSRIPRPSAPSARPRSQASDSSLSSGPNSDQKSQPEPQAAPKKPAARISRVKRAPSQAPPPRVTRSVSQRQQKGLQAGSSRAAGNNATPGPSAVPEPSTSTPRPLPRETTDGNAAAGPSAAPVASTSNHRPTTPGLSHKRSYTSSFAQPTSSSLSKAVEKSPVKKPVSLPKPLSPTKPTSPRKPASSILEYMKPKVKQSSLSALSNALEKLLMPPPVRPGTHLGFAHGADKPSAAGSATRDDVDVGRTSASGAVGRKSASVLQRANTVGSMSSASSSRPGPSLASRPSAAFAPPVAKSKINLGSGIVVGKRAFPGAGPGKIFAGVGNGRPAQRASKKSSLPMVEGSPVKGGAPASDRVGGEDKDKGKGKDKADETMEGLSANTSREIKPIDFTSLLTDDPSLRMALDLPGASLLPAEPIPEGHDAWKHNASRRASMASQLLSHTLSELPQTPPRPPSRAAKEDARPRRSGSPGRLKTLRSANVSGGGGSGVASGMRSAPGALGKGSGEGSHVAAGKSGEGSSEASGSGLGSGGKAAASGEKVGSLKVLKKCTIFVDVRTDEGDDAGALFVDMLKGLGARVCVYSCGCRFVLLKISVLQVIGRAGQSCTHIVYKNGQSSTLTKYRSMPDPKPFVIGIAWVVECVEQRKRVDEERFLVDLEFANVAGANKRRRSMLPKHMFADMTSTPMHPPPVPSGSGSGGTPSTADSSMEANISMDGSESSATSSRLGLDDDDNLPPLERARRRRSMMLKFATSGAGR
ncbi:hypothetical protein DENSPDRAFT_710872 [Dentipellis sp. KUC8613]|nr:hypothetical protein DENSPDRAFT_710872 [Dentipellis sp. KUC8613]